MAEEAKYKIRKSKDGKLYQVFRPDGSTRPFFLSLEKFKPPVPVEAIRYGASARRAGVVAHRSGAYFYDNGNYWRQFVTIGDVNIARRGDTTEEEVDASDPRVIDFFVLAAPVRVEDAARVLAAHRRAQAEAGTADAVAASASTLAQD